MKLRDLVTLPPKRDTWYASVDIIKAPNLGFNEAIELVGEIETRSPDSYVMEGFEKGRMNVKLNLPSAIEIKNLIAGFDNLDASSKAIYSRIHDA